MVLVGVHQGGDLSLLPGRDDPVEPGHGAASGGLGAEDLQRRVPLVAHHEGVGERLAPLDLEAKSNELSL